MIKEFSSMVSEFHYMCHPPVEPPGPAEGRPEDKLREIRGIHSPKKNTLILVDYPDAQLRRLPGNDTWSCFQRHRESA